MPRGGGEFTALVERFGQIEMRVDLVRVHETAFSQESMASSAWPSARKESVTHLHVGIAREKLGELCVAVVGFRIAPGLEQRAGVGLLQTFVVRIDGHRARERVHRCVAIAGFGFRGRDAGLMVLSHGFMRDAAISDERFS